MPGRRRRRSELSALRNRVTSNQYATVERYETRRRSVLLSNTGMWAAPPREQSIGFAVWFAALSWQLAAEFLDGGTDDDETPGEIVTGCEQMAALAERWTDFAVRVEGQPGDVPPIGMQELWLPPVTDVTGRAVWRAADTAVGWVERDWATLGGSSIPPRFATLGPHLQAQYQPALQLMGYLREQWLLTTDASVYANLAARAVGPTAEILRVGQKLWAPYLIGTAWTQARDRRLGLEDLQLGFDPWLLTDKDNARRRRTDPASQDALTAFWRGLARPRSAQHAADELAAALRHRRIRYRSSDGLPLPPWPAQYMVRFPLRLGDRNFASGDLVSLFVTDAPEGQRSVEIRRSGRLTSRADLLGA